MKKISELAQRGVSFTLMGLTAGLLSNVISAQVGSADSTNGGNSPPEVKLVSPENGAHFTAPATIYLAAQGSDLDGWIRTVEFFANDRSLGVTTNNPLSASPVNPFQLTWTNVPAGEYALRAKATDDRGASAISPAVKATVSSTPQQAEVSVAAIKAEATELGDSKSRTLAFRFVRTGSMEIDLPVFYSVQGTATMGQDFPNLPGTITIPKGAEAAELNFEVISDNLAEPEEMVIIRVEPPVCVAIFPPPPECYRVGVRAEARGLIRDNSAPDLPVVSLDAIIPETGEASDLALVRPGRFAIAVRGGGSGSFPIFFEIGGTASNGEDYKKIAKWVIVPGTTNTVNVDIAALDDPLVEGDESVELKLTTQQSDDFPLMMPIREYAIDPAHAAARVVIHDNDRPPTAARLEITAPQDGQFFLNAEVITISATAIDPNGYIPRVEFYAGEEKIGVSELTFIRAPDPGTPLMHTFDWKRPPAGLYQLTARAVDAAGGKVISKPVGITVERLGERVVVAIEATDAKASESAGPDGAVDTATFTIRRTAGPRDVAVTVLYALSGTAANGIDYRSLDGQVTLASGQDTAQITIAPIPDKALEGDETVLVSIKEPLCAQIFPPPPECYQIAPPGSARAVIQDSTTGQPPKIAITRPVSGAGFSFDSPIEIVAEAQDADGFVSKVEFLADDRTIGAQILAVVNPPPVGLEQTFRFVWRDASPGPHVLTVRATDNDGLGAVSPPVEIKVSEPDARTVVMVMTRDALAVEPQFNAALNTASFVFRRVGSTNDALAVNYSVRGTAQNGVDYEKLSGVATIPAGARHTTVVVQPKADDLSERFETVIVQLEPTTTSGSPTPLYRVGRPARAAAVIRDNWLARSSVETAVGATCTALADGLLHINFRGQAGANFRVEASDDCLHWETIAAASANETGVDFVDEPAGVRQKFYRMVPELAPLLDE